GTQDNGVLVSRPALNNPGSQTSWRMLLGGDGAFVAPLTGLPPLLFAAAQFGALFRFEAGNNKAVAIKPKSPRNFEPFRFNWLAPLLASRQQKGGGFFRRQQGAALKRQRLILAGNLSRSQ
ncbi:MAG: hypothetical protein KJ772_08095, partial [Proteobacteria bacterium]|nr:hypothetical protein [Pseudomonadota bacterium]